MGISDIRKSNESLFRIKNLSLRIISRKFFILLPDIIFYTTRFPKFLQIEISDGSGGFLTSGRASGSKSQIDWGRISTIVYILNSRVDNCCKIVSSAHFGYDLAGTVIRVDSEESAESLHVWSVGWWSSKWRLLIQEWWNFRKTCWQDHIEFIFPFYEGRNFCGST